MKCPICNHDMIPDRWGPESTIHGYDCNFCERYFTTVVLEQGIFDKEEGEERGELN